MTIKPINFEGITNFSDLNLDEFQSYLNEQENLLALAILRSLHLLDEQSLKKDKQKRTLKDAIEAFKRKNEEYLKSNKQQPLVDGDWKHVAYQINTALWQFVEVIEGLAAELFQQVGQTNFDQWSDSLIHAVETMNKSLCEKIDIVIENFRDLEYQLWELRQAVLEQKKKSSFLGKWLSWWRSLLDRTIVTHLNRCRYFLTSSFKQFSETYYEYNKLEQKANDSIQKFSNYKVLCHMEELSQKQFKVLYRMLRIWRLSAKSKLKSFPRQELGKAIRNLMKAKEALAFFQVYFDGIKTHLFDASRKIKENGKKIVNHPKIKAEMEEIVYLGQVELHTLGATVANYREFLLNTDPNPYVRSRLGFSDWVVGPEPVTTKALLYLEYEIEKYDALYTTLLDSIKNKTSYPVDIRMTSLHEEIQETLHEMAQPTMIRTLIRSKAERLIEQLKQCNEIGSFSLDILDYMDEMLEKALRSDWKYHVLHEMPAFHDLYQIHMGIVGPSVDQEFLKQKQTFSHLLHHLEKWASKAKIVPDLEEIQPQVNEIKDIFRKMYESLPNPEDEIKSPKKVLELVKKMRAQMLQMRYIVGNFYRSLVKSERGRQHKHRFQFIDQDLESIDRRLESLKSQAIQLEQIDKVDLSV